MKKYDVKKIMNDAWRRMRANSVGGVYQISLSEALKAAWSSAKRALREAEYAEKVLKSGKYDYIIHEDNPWVKDDLVRKALDALRDEGEKNVRAYREGLMTRSELLDYQCFKLEPEKSLVASFRKKPSRPVWNSYAKFAALGPLPEEEF